MTWKIVTLVLGLAVCVTVGAMFITRAALKHRERKRKQSEYKALCDLINSLHK